jgi:hypothetical protein
MAPQLRLQRYLLKNGSHGDYFGEHLRGEGEFFHWFVTAESPERIGIASNARATESAQFLAGILKATNSLGLFSSPTNARMCAIGLNRSEVVSVTESYSPAQMVALVDELKTGRLKHVFYASENPDGSSPRILTFSPMPPSPDLYRTGLGVIGPMEIEISK